MKGFWAKTRANYTNAGGSRIIQKYGDAVFYGNFYIDDLLVLRKLYEDMLVAYINNIGGESWWFGFSPRTFAQTVLETAGIDIRKCDLGFEILLYTETKIAEGDWNKYPTGVWKTLKNTLFKHGAPQR